VPLTIAELMSKMPGAFLREKAAGIDAVIHFKFMGQEAGEWNAVIKNGTCEVAQGIPRVKPTISLSADSADFIKVFTGELNGMAAYMQGKFKLVGDMGLAMKLPGMFKLQ
jgi:putative sterol carrier protein